MTSRDFCYWLQGFFELRAKGGGVTEEQAICIARHLAMVFKHEIDPSAGDAAHQAVLNETHEPTKPAKPHPPIGGGSGPHGVTYRC